MLASVEQAAMILPQPEERMMENHPFVRKEIILLESHMGMKRAGLFDKLRA
jgi:hypothetical protein